MQAKKASHKFSCVLTKENFVMEGLCPLCGLF